MKKKILLAVCITALFAFKSVIGQTPVTTPGGTAGYVPLWNATLGGNSYSIVNSNIFMNGNTVGFGTATPQANIHLKNNLTTTSTTLRFETQDMLNGTTITDLINYNGNFIIKREDKNVLTINYGNALLNNQLLIDRPNTTDPDILITKQGTSYMPSIGLNYTYDNGGGGGNGEALVTKKFEIINDGDLTIRQNNDNNMIDIISFNSSIIETPSAINMTILGRLGLGMAPISSNKLTVGGTSLFCQDVTIGRSGNLANLTVNGNSIFNGNTTITGNTIYNGNFSIGTTTATERLNVKGNILLESHTSHSAGAFKIENITDNYNNNYFDRLKISYNNIPNSFIEFAPQNCFWINKLNLAITDGDFTITDANENRNIYIHKDGRIYGKKLLLSETEMWPDYVFEDNYELQSLPELENYLKENKHLPDMPTASQIKENGLDVGAVNTQLVKKVEELTLYLIEQNKQIEAQQKQIEELIKKVNK